MSTDTNTLTEAAPIPASIKFDIPRIEAAIVALARAAAQAGGRSPSTMPPPGPARDDRERLIEQPVLRSLMLGEATLLQHLGAIAGREYAAAFNRRVNEGLFEEFDRPRLEASGAKQ